jgi:hypothetical protein
MFLRTRMAAPMLALMLGLSACGSSSHPKRHATPAPSATPATATATAPQTTATATTPSTTSASAPAFDPAATDPTTTPLPVSPTATATAVPSGAVALIGQTAITKATFSHWLGIAVKGERTSKGAPTIYPDYPTFTHCIATARTIKTLAQKPRSVLLQDCQQLFNSLSPQVLDFLVRSVWFEDAARHDGVAPTTAQVARAFATEKHKQFPTAKKFNRFLATSGESVADIRFRVVVNLAYAALGPRHGGQTKLQTYLSTIYKPVTQCATGYPDPSDCAS